MFKFDRLRDFTDVNLLIAVTAIAIYDLNLDRDRQRFPNVRYLCKYTGIDRQTSVWEID
jgi:hypothetical protein